MSRSGREGSQLMLRVCLRRVSGQELSQRRVEQQRRQLLDGHSMTVDSGRLYEPSFTEIVVKCILVLNYHLK